MQLTIIPVDGAVYVDGVSFVGLDLSFVPTDIHALQWYDSYGEVEFKRSFIDGKLIHPENQIISELPSWANDAKAVWDSAKLADDARIASDNAQLTSNTEQP
jgi:hypothetical protein